MNWLAQALALAAVVTAAALPVERSESLAERDTQCVNGPNTRACWVDGYSIATDFDKKHPTTGKTVTYNLEITNSTCNPDGHGSRLCFLINGQYPGPVLTADWGDYVVVNVKNSLQNNGTGLHFHGVRMLNSCGSDGVNGITQCPIAPGSSMTYNFQVTQFGTSWYHSHFSSQYGDGVVGPMIFNGPASANYDIDLGPYPINDWTYKTAFQMNALASQSIQSNGPPPAMDSILINGTNKASSGAGQYNYVTVTSGKRYRLRLINMSVDNYIRVSLDSHNFLVITSDFVPVIPFAAQQLLLGAGQRYDVVITANQTASNYWFRASVATDCQSSNNNNGLAVWTYSGVTVQNPTTLGPINLLNSCKEPSPLSPYWVQPVPSGTFSTAADSLSVNLTKAVVVPGGDSITVWALNTSSIDVSWEHPTLSYIMNGTANYPKAFSVLPTVATGSWNYWLIQQASGMPPVPHPIHLHGHDFFVIGQGSGTFSASSATLNWQTPPRRDTATVPSQGWLALAYLSNNPGAWLMHCHIAWHISEGLGVQFIEAPGSMQLPDATAYNKVCADWQAYAPNAYWAKDDSGI